MPAEGFIGVTKDAYQAAREIPKRSLSFHATATTIEAWATKASIAVSKTITPLIVPCVGEVLSAYRLQKRAAFDRCTNPRSHNRAILPAAVINAKYFQSLGSEDAS